MSTWTATNYAAIWAFGLRKAWRERFVIVMPLVIYILLVTLYASVFRITPFEELTGTVAIRMETMIWYFTLTELIAVSFGFGFREVRDDVLGGAVATALHRPLSYVRLKLLEWAGRMAFDLPVFAAVGFVMAYQLTGMVPFGVEDIPFLLISIVLSALTMSCFYLAVGLMETWGPYARPAFWILQKVMFLFGGLILPIAVYPALLQKISWATPFPAILTVPARIAFDPGVATMAAGVAVQIFWLGAAVLIAASVQARVNRSLLEGRA